MALAAEPERLQQKDEARREALAERRRLEAEAEQNRIEQTLRQAEVAAHQQVERRRQAEEARQAAESERLRQVEDARQKVAEEARRQAELRRQVEEAQQAAKRERLRQEEEARQRAEQERLRLEAEAEQQRLEQARRQAQEEARRQKELRHQAEEARQAAEHERLRQEEEEARRQAEAERRRLEAERQRQEKALRNAAETARRQEAAARKQAELERQQQEEQAKRQAAEEKRLRRQELLAHQQREEKERLAQLNENRRQDEIRIRQEQEACLARLELTRAKLRSEPALPAANTAEFQEAMTQLLVERQRWLGDWGRVAGAAQAPAIAAFEAVERRRWQLERSCLTTSNQQTELRNRFRGKLSDFLLKPLEIPLGSVRLPTAFALLNPFRLVSQPATISVSVLSESAQKALSQLRNTPGQAVGMGIGLRKLVRSPQLSQSWNPILWNDRRSRFVAELFWLHLPESEFDLIRESADLTSFDTLAVLQELLPTADEKHALHIQHGLAVFWLSVAVAREAAFAAGHIANGLGYWDIALHSWSRLIAAESFWSYFAERASAVGVPIAFVQEIRQQIPLYLSGLVGRFARAYVQQGDSVACHRLLSILRRSEFSEEVREAVASAVVRASFY